MNAESIISKVWSFCTTLRDDGVGYGDYLEQLTYLIFLKLADEYSKPPYNREVGVPEDLAAEIIDNIEAGLNRFREVVGILRTD